jgi:cyanophycinase
MKRLLLLGSIASVTLLLSACNDEEPQSTGQLALVGGAIHACSSMATSDCADWDSYRSSALAELGDDQIRTPVELGVSLGDSRIELVVEDPAWDENPSYDQANQEILANLQATLSAPNYLYSTWDEFKSAYINASSSVDNGDGGFLSGDDIWYSSSDAQWSTLARLQQVDDTFKYTVTQDKVENALNQTDIAGLESSLLSALTETLEASIYDEAVLQDDLVDYFGQVNVVDASINGWKLFKKYLSDDEFDFMLAALDPEADDSFSLTEASIASIESDDTVSWDEYNRSDLVAVLNYLRADAGGDQSYASYGELRTAITSSYLDDSQQAVNYDYEFGSDAWAALSGVAQNVVLQTLVDPLLDYQRPLEYVNLADSNDSDSVRVLEAIVERAQGEKEQAPKVLIMTSSSNNSYDAIDFYLQAFMQAGAEAQWLPIDRAYQDAKAMQRCDLLPAIHSSYASDAHIDLLYPDYAALHQAACDDEQSVLALIAEADAVFINGGGQRRSLDALMPELGETRADSPEMALIRERFNAGELLVGGTSAGTAVQGGSYLNAAANVTPMIDGGQAYEVTQSGYDSGIAVFEGGLGLFNYGITDTHFSERARETRLIKLAEQSQVQFGFGVDETTALFVDKMLLEGEPSAQMSVLGKGGVFVADLAAASVNSGEGDSLDIDNVIVHYLTEGDTMDLNPTSASLAVSLAGEHIPVDPSASIVNSDDVMYQDNYRSLMQDMVSSGAAEAYGSSYEDDPTMELHVVRGPNAVTALNKSKASYSDLRMSIYPQP